MNKFENAVRFAMSTWQPVITATQKKQELTPYQMDILESMDKMKSCDVIISITKDRTPGPHHIKMEYNGDGFIRSLFKK